MKCTKCTNPILKGQPYHRTKLGFHHRDCTKAEITPQNMNNSKVNELRNALKNIMEIAEEGRMSVSPISKCVNQIDIECAEAVCRGYFMTIAQFAEAIYSKTDPV